jgi:hypothetical protein
MCENTPLPESLRDLPNIAELPRDILQLWSKYEDIAMHFNELILKLRTQALATLAAIISLAATVGQSQSQPNWLILGYISIFLLLCWVALYCLDYRYYTDLLKGAVHAIRQLEHYHPFIKISTIIELRTKDHRKQIQRFYVIVAFALFLLILLSFNCFNIRNFLEQNIT